MSEKKEHKPLSDAAYYVTMYKLQGHETWRVSIAQNPDHFETVEKKNWPPTVVVTEKNVIRIDRITGQIKPL